VGVVSSLIGPPFLRALTGGATVTTTAGWPRMAVTVRTARCRAAHPDRQHTVVAVNVDALVRLTRTVPPAISPTPTPDYPSRVRPPRQQSQLAVGAQFVMVAGLTYRTPVWSILLSRNRFTKSFDGWSLLSITD
jgi:hypothetical protein